MVIKVPIDVEFRKVDTAFKKLWDSTTEEAVVRKLNAYLGKHTENKKITRFERIEDNVVYLSEIDYNDMLMVDAIPRYVYDFPEVKRICDTVRSEGITSNALGISLLVVDKNGDVKLTQRGPDPIIGANYLGVTCTATATGDPFSSCWNLFPDLDRLDFTDIFIGPQKKQPVAIMTGYINRELDSKVMDPETAAIALSHKPSTEAARYHLHSYIARKIAGED